VKHQSPKAFRDFLLSAPHKFLGLGEKLGAISHIVSFWRYRFPPGRYTTVNADDLCAIFQDFCSGFGEKIKTEDSVIRRPAVIDTAAARAFASSFGKYPLCAVLKSSPGCSWQRSSSSCSS